MALVAWGAQDVVLTGFPRKRQKKSDNVNNLFGGVNGETANHVNMQDIFSDSTVELCCASSDNFGGDNDDP